jgi:hypothetical protein
VRIEALTVARTMWPELVREIDIKDAGEVQTALGKLAESIATWVQDPSFAPPQPTLDHAKILQKAGVRRVGAHQLVALLALPVGGLSLPSKPSPTARDVKAAAARLKKMTQRH